MEVRTPQQGLEDDPVTRIPLSITGLLKPEFRDLPTDRIHASLLSFETLLRRIERGSAISFDAARDELGWVEDAPELGPKQFRRIVNEITFHNAIGVTQLLTTQSKPLQEIMLYLWSPAPKESVFRRSRRAPESRPSTSGEEPETQVGGQQPLSLLLQAVVEASRNPSVGEVSSNLPGPSASRAASPSQKPSLAEDVDPSSPDPEVHPQPTTAEKPPHGLDHVTPQRTSLDSTGLGGSGLADRAKDRSWENDDTPPSSSLLGHREVQNEDSDDDSREETGTGGFNSDDPQDGASNDPEYNEGSGETVGSSSLGLDDAGDHGLSNFDSGSETLLTPSEYPAKGRAIELNLGALLGTISPDDVRGEEKQPGETDKEYELRRAVDIQMLAELESERHVDTTFLPHSSMLMPVLQTSCPVRKQGVRATGCRKVALHLQVSQSRRGPKGAEVLRQDSGICAATPTLPGTLRGQDFADAPRE